MNLKTFASKLLKNLSNSYLLLKLFCSSRILAKLFFFFFSDRFSREQYQALIGKAEYLRRRSHASELESSSFLRRNIHRLEKGLIMKPRRSVFAESYILDTVKHFQKLVTSQSSNSEELYWSYTVLDSYFKACDNTQIVNKAKILFELASKNFSFDQCISKNSPKILKYSDLQNHNIKFEDLSILSSHRKSVRWFSSHQVPDYLFLKIISIALTAPSACNRQPFRFIVSNNPSNTEKICQCAGGTVGFSHQVPAVIVVVGDLSAFVHERDRHLIYIDASLASMQLMLAAETLGLATCAINWPDVKKSHDKISNEINLEPWETVILLIAVGFPDPCGLIPYSQKKSCTQLTTFLK